MEDTISAPQVLLVDDQAIVRTGMRRTLAAHGVTVVGEASRPGDAHRLARELRPDVVVLDVDRPALDALTLTKSLRTLQPAPAVLVLCSAQSTGALDALLAGACGQVLRDGEPEALAASIRRAASGETTLAPAIALRLVERLRELEAERQARTPVQPAAPLTTREQEVLRLLAAGRDNSSIGDSLFISAGTVKHHVTAIFGKLGAVNRAQAAAEAVRIGIA